MAYHLRPGRPADAQICGRICYDAFHAISTRHGFPPDFDNPESATGLISTLLGQPEFYSVVAESGGRVVGSNFLDERSSVVGVGPVTVAPDVQDSGVGRALMRDVMERASRVGAPGIRLVQATYHARSLSLYAKLGFQVRDLLACVNGPGPGGELPGYQTRPGLPSDVAACDQLCRDVHGHDRSGEVVEAVARGSALVVERQERVTGYATSLGLFGHAVGETNEDVQALLLSAGRLDGPGVLLPTSNAELFSWCLSRGFRVVALSALMTVGFYQPPKGASVPSVFF